MQRPASCSRCRAVATGARLFESATATAYVHVSSVDFLPGLLALLHSLRRQRDTTDPSPMTHVMLFHPNVSDSMLSASQASLLECAAGSLGRVLWTRIDDERARLWLAVKLASRTGVSSLLKMEMFFLTGFRALVFMDADMCACMTRPSAPRHTLPGTACTLLVPCAVTLRLVLRPMGTVWEALLVRGHSSNRSAAAWTLHGSAPRLATGRPFLNCGFIALSAPPPPSFQQALLRVCESAVKRGAIPRMPGIKYPEAHKSEQELVNHALWSLHRHPKIHVEWRANYRPASTAELPSWRALHWHGTSKPWGARGAFSNRDRLDDELAAALRSRWAAEYAAFRRASCASSDGAVAALAALAQARASRNNGTVPATGVDHHAPPARRAALARPPPPPPWWRRAVRNRTHTQASAACGARQTLQTLLIRG